MNSQLPTLCQIEDFCSNLGGLGTIFQEIIKMKVKPRIRRMTLLACLLVLVPWLGLFMLGWYERHPDEGPFFNGKSLLQCGHAISAGGKRFHPELMKSLKDNKDAVVSLAIQWTKARDSLAYNVYFDFMYSFYGKRDYLNRAHDYGIPAHMYRYSGVVILGEIAMDIPEARQALERMATDPEINDRERETARAFLGLPRLSNYR